MPSKTGKNSSSTPADAAEKPARRGTPPPAPAGDTGRAAAEPTTVGGKAPSARKAPARKAPGAGVAGADVPAVRPPAEGETGAAASEPTTAGGKGRRKAPGTGVADTASAAPAKKPAAKTAARSASKPAAKTGRGGKRESFQETATRREGERAQDQLQEDLRAFAGARPSGWNHDDWTSFLAELAAKGHDCSEPGQIGARLERERLALSLEAIHGVEHSGVEALANRFQTLWSARHASAADIARTAGIPEPQAERVLHALREL